MRNPTHELAVQFSEVIPTTMWRIRMEVRQLAKSEFTVPQFRILGLLNRGLANNNQLAEMQGVSVASMSRMVDGLVRRGLVSRSIGKSDRRKVELKLSKKGAKEFQNLRKAAQARFVSWFSVLTESEQETLQKGLTVLKKISIGKKSFNAEN